MIYRYRKHIITGVVLGVVCVLGLIAFVTWCDPGPVKEKTRMGLWGDGF